MPLIARTWKPTLRDAVLAIAIAFIGCAQPGSTPTKTMARPKVVLEEATRLDKEVEALFRRGKTQEAILLAERSLAVREQALGPHHLDVAANLQDLGILYKAQKAYTRAESFHARALAIQEQALGAMHPDVATTLNSLALLHKVQGAYARAEPLYRRALAIRERALGAKHQDVATILSNLGALYQDQGAYARAESLYLRELEIREKAQGARHPDVAIALNNLATLYIDQGEYARAEPLFIRALGIKEQALGAVHPNVAYSLNDLATLYLHQGELARAEPLYLRALAIREQALGAGHPDLATTLNNLAELYGMRGEPVRAEPLHLRALAIREQALGSMHPEVANSLHNLGSHYKAQGEYARAEPLLVRGLEIAEKVLGAAHPNTAHHLNSLAGLYQAWGAYARAEPLRVRALDIRERALGAMHPAVANALNNLADLYHAQGAYARAEPLLIRALAIREQALGATHPNVAETLNNLARSYQAQGRYAQAEPYLVRALQINERALGAVHPLVAINVGNLAVLYEDQGAYARAEPLYVRALDIVEKAHGPMHPAVANALNNLASAHYAKEAYGRAMPLYVRALDIMEKTLGPTHPNVATGLHNIGEVYRAQGAYAQAEAHFRRALDIAEKGLGPAHPTVAQSLGMLAALHHDRGAYTRAEPLYLRALAIREQALGVMHPAVARSLDDLAVLYHARGMPARAEPLLARSVEIREAHLRIELAHLSESRKRGMMSLLQGQTEGLVSLHAHALPSSPRVLELALTTVLRRKGRVLDSLVDTQTALRAHLTPPLRDKLAQLADASTRLSTRLRARFDPQTAENQKAEITALRGQIEELEAELNTASAEFRARAEPISLARVQAALPRGSALVEIVRYRRYDARKGKVASPWREARYLAYILRPQGSPQWVALGEAARIDAEVDAMLAAMRKDSGADTARAALRNLDALVFAPIRGRLGDASHVIVSPDGRLNQVPFEALVDPQGRYALEQRLVSYVTSGRDLLRLASRQSPRSPTMIIADPDYGPAGQSYVRVDGTTAEMYSRLAGTLAEANAVRGHFADARMLTEGEATKAALAAVTGPAVLHIATHGFYTRAAGPSAMPLVVVRERGMSVQSSGLSPAPPPEVDPIEALDRAGLVLAGANVGPEGIISARELANRDLWGTQLVVLSACGTGLGEVSSGKGAHGEGVYGMRRALVLAGAQTQVVSLWNVNDSSAPELMREFYAELARGTGRAEALRRAKLRMLRQPQLAHPYYWAAFIAAGDWTPLDKGIMRPVEPAR